LVLDSTILENIPMESNHQLNWNITLSDVTFLIRGLWARGTDCIIDGQIADVHAKFNWSEGLDRVSAAHERKKKKKCLEACLEQHRHFSPFLVSADGLLGEETKILLRRDIIGMLAKKWRRNPAPMSAAVSMLI
jgi:hypothetical protein